MKQGQHVPVGNDLNRDQDRLETRLHGPDVTKVVLTMQMQEPRVTPKIVRAVLVSVVDEEEGLQLRPFCAPSVSWADRGQAKANRTC